MAAFGGHNFELEVIWLTVLQLTLKLVIFIAVGFAARKLRVMPDGFDRMLTRFVMAIPLPCMIINSFNVEFSMQDLINCPVLLALAVGSMAAQFVIAQLIYIKMGRTGVARSARFALLFTNFTFFGLPVVSELYGAQGVFYYVIFTLPIRIIFYGGAPLTLGEPGRRLDVKDTVKKFICEPVVAVFIGFFLYVTQLPLPEVIESAVSTLGNMASPLGLILCGSIIADAQLKGVLKYPCVLWVTALRLLVMPAVMMGAFLLLGVEHDIVRTTVFYFAMPVASFLPTFCLRYNPEEADGRVAGGYMVIVSMIACVATVPLWAMVTSRL